MTLIWIPLTTSSDNETDSNYDPSDSDYSDSEDIEGDFLEARERAFGNIWKHIPLEDT